VRVAQAPPPLEVRDDRLADIQLAFLQLGCALICLNFWQRRF